MITALVLTSDGPDAPPLAHDLECAGFRVAYLTQCTNLVQSVIKSAPDVFVVFEDSPDAALFDSIATLGDAAPRPVALFTPDPDAEKIGRATRSGVHAYVVNGYSPGRLRSVIHLAQARFKHDRSIRDELAAVNQRFAERKLVDRARGILMGARQLREEEAYRALRSAAMHAKQRIGQVAQRVIEGARYGEAINRAGQLRMFSQRLAKLYALRCAGLRTAETDGLMADSRAHVDLNIASLSRLLSAATFGDLVQAVAAPWQRLAAMLDAPAQTARLGEMDALAEAMLVRADQLTANLEIAGYAAALHVINVAGRQRMLSQRLAKEAIIGALLGPAAAGAAAAAMAATRAELSAGLDYLRTLPLSNAEIGRELHATTEAWSQFEAALACLGEADGLEATAALSEALLAHFERLTDHLERAMQALVF